MGREARCSVRWQGRTSEGKALLETSEILFRGGFRLKLPFAAIESVRASGGRLVVKTAEGTASFGLGPESAVWAERILNPKPVLDKLGVKPGMTVSVLGPADAALARQARDRSATVSVGRARPDSDLLFLFAETGGALARLAAARRAIRPNGGIWVLWPKGRPALTEDHVRSAARAAGLVDVKVVSYSPTHSGLKLVIPVASRGKTA